MEGVFSIISRQAVPASDAPVSKAPLFLPLLFLLPRRGTLHWTIRETVFLFFGTSDQRERV